MKKLLNSDWQGTVQSPSIIVLKKGNSNFKEYLAFTFNCLERSLYMTTEIFKFQNLIF